jgi:hypothetical protein
MRALSGDGVTDPAAAAAGRGTQAVDVSLLEFVRQMATG